MANGYNPYQIAGIQQSIIDSLSAADQSRRRGQEAIGQQKSEMISDFEKESIAKQKEAERIQAKQRKKKGKGLLTALKLIPGLGEIVGALEGVVNLRQDKKFERNKLRQLRDLGVGNVEEYGGTFLGSQARQAESGFTSQLDEMQRNIDDIGTSDYLLAGLGGGLKGASLGRLGGNIGISDSFFKDLFSGQSPLSLRNTLDSGKLMELVKSGDINVSDIVAGDKSTKEGLLKSLFQNIGKDFGGFDQEGLGFLENLLKGAATTGFFEQGGKVQGEKTASQIVYDLKRKYMSRLPRYEDTRKGKIEKAKQRSKRDAKMLKEYNRRVYNRKR